MMQVRMGIIGLGNMGSAHAKSILDGKVPELRLTAVADRKEERRRWAREHCPDGIEVLAEGEALAKSDACDAVLIATPHDQHPELTIVALEHGKHVLCEKPAGVYTKQVRRMNEVAAASDPVFAMMFNQRTNCVYRKLHEMIHDGSLGEIKRINWIITDWYRTQAYYDSGNWRATWAGEGGGVLLNQCPHNLDLLQWLFGMPTKVRAFCHNGKWHDIEVEDDVTAYLEFPNGATGVFVTSTGDAPGTNRLEVTTDLGRVVCENGKLIWDRLEENERLFCQSATGGFDLPKVHREEIALDGENQQHVGVLAAFAGRILHGTALIADGSEGINGLTLSNAMHLSAWLGETVELPFDEDLFFQLLQERCDRSQKKSGAERVLDTEGSY